jgi:hypothetical protein
MGPDRAGSCGARSIGKFSFAFSLLISEHRPEPPHPQQLRDAAHPRPAPGQALPLGFDGHRRQRRLDTSIPAK